MAATRKKPTKARKASTTKKPAAKKKAAPKKTAAKKAAPKKAVAKKAPPKKAAAKKAAPKRAVAKKAAPKKAAAPRKAKTYKDPLTKSKLVEEIATNVGITKKEVAAVFENLAEIVGGHLKKRAARKFTLPGLCTMVTKTKPARKARKGINPFTGEEMMFKAKPASQVVKIRPAKKLKEMAES